MKSDRKSFILYNDSISTIEMMPDKDAGMLIKHIFRYVNKQDLGDYTDLSLLAFQGFKTHIDRDNEKYKETCRARQEAGKLGGRPKKPNDKIEKQKNQMVFEKTKQNQTKAKKADSDSDSVNDSDSEKKKKSRFAPPSQEEVKNYMKLKSYTDFSESFMSHYQSNGWKVGKNPMKDWKAAIRGWVSRDSKLIEKHCDWNQFETKKEKIEHCRKNPDLLESLRKHDRTLIQPVEILGFYK
jgi:hypothetical protein